jgi:hypothetical protein
MMTRLMINLFMEMLCPNKVTALVQNFFTLIILFLLSIVVLIKNLISDFCSLLISLAHLSVLAPNGDAVSLTSTINI